MTGLNPVRDLMWVEKMIGSYSFVPYGTIDPHEDFHFYPYLVPKGTFANLSVAETEPSHTIRVLILSENRFSEQAQPSHHKNMLCQVIWLTSGFEFLNH
jgi:hypothetical protein